MRICFFLLLALSGPALAWEKAVGPAYTGDIRWEDIAAAGLGPLRVRVYLPPHAKGHLPVLYACDGQSCFQSGQYGDWHMDEIADRMIRAGQIPPLIIVTVDAPSGDFRLAYYTARRTWDSRHHTEVGGQAEQYARYLLQLKGRIDAEFPTDPKDAALIGSSLGGLFAIYGGYAHPEVFGRVAALSPSLWWADRPGNGDLVASPAHGPGRVWLDIGTREGVEKAEWQENVDNTRLMGEWLKAGGQGTAVHYASYPDAEHSEKWWSQRLPEVLSWLYDSRRLSTP